MEINPSFAQISNNQPPLNIAASLCPAAVRLYICALQCIAPEQGEGCYELRDLVPGMVAAQLRKGGVEQINPLIALGPALNEEAAARLLAAEVGADLVLWGTVQPDEDALLAAASIVTLQLTSRDGRTQTLRGPLSCIDVSSTGSSRTALLGKMAATIEWAASCLQAAW